MFAPTPCTALRSTAGCAYAAGVDGVQTWLRDAPPERITGRTVDLRRWGADDLDEQLRAIHDSISALVRWMAWAEGYDRGSGAEFLERSRRSWEERSTFAYAVRAADDRIVGAMGLHARIGRGGLEIGYWTRSTDTRRGYATRAAALLTAAALALDAVTFTEIHHDRANALSGRIPPRLGYRHVATVERDPEAPGESGTALYWQMTADEYPNSAAAAIAREERLPPA